MAHCSSSSNGSRVSVNLQFCKVRLAGPVLLLLPGIEADPPVHRDTSKRDTSTRDSSMVGAIVQVGNGSRVGAIVQVGNGSRVGALMQLCKQLHSLSWLALR
jgi:hypothetical protein